MKEEYHEITEETAENMGYLPELYKATVKEFDGEYIFGKTLDSRIEKRYMENKEERTKKFGVTKNGLVKVPVRWLKEHNFI